MSNSTSRPQLPQEFTEFLMALKARPNASNKERAAALLFEALVRHQVLLTAAQLRQMLGCATIVANEALRDFRTKLAAPLQRAGGLAGFMLASEIPQEVVSEAGRAFSMLWERASAAQAATFAEEKLNLTARAERAEAIAHEARIHAERDRHAAADQLRRAEDLSRNLAAQTQEVARLASELASAVASRDQALAESLRASKGLQEALSSHAKELDSLRADHRGALEHERTQAAQTLAEAKASAQQQQAAATKRLEAVDAALARERSANADLVIKEAHASRDLSDARARIEKLEAQIAEAASAAAAQAKQIAALQAEKAALELLLAQARERLVVQDEAGKRLGAQAAQIATWLRRRPAPAAHGATENEQTKAHGALEAWQAEVPATESAPLAIVVSAAMQ